MMIHREHQSVNVITIYFKVHKSNRINIYCEHFNKYHLQNITFFYVNNHEKFLVVKQSKWNLNT